MSSHLAKLNQGMENLKTGNQLKLMGAEGRIAKDLIGAQGEQQRLGIRETGAQERLNIAATGVEQRAGIREPVLSSARACASREPKIARLFGLRARKSD